LVEIKHVGLVSKKDIMHLSKDLLLPKGTLCDIFDKRLFGIYVVVARKDLFTEYYIHVSDLYAYFYTKQELRKEKIDSFLNKYGYE
jgi:hypothetical protein